MHTAALRAALEALHTRALSYPEMELIVRSFHALALAYIGRKVSAGRLETSRLGVSLDDLAVDCIADLFTRDDQGRFSVLQSYFSGADLRSMPESELLGLSRRLVFSAVNQQLFRIYGSYDPGFRKLLRNLKGAAHRAPGIQLVEHQGDTWVLFSANGAHGDGRPVIPPEYLEALLAQHISVRSSSGDMLRAVGLALSENPPYARGYPFIGLASVLRQMLARMEVVDEPEHDDAVSVAEIDRVLGDVLPGVLSEIGVRYIREGKLGQEVLEAYRLAVREILLMEFGHGNGHDVSFYDILSTLLPGTTQAEYAEEHRSRLEYLVRVSRRRFLGRMEENL
jgi:hypothetical protein